MKIWKTAVLVFMVFLLLPLSIVYGRGYVPGEIIVRHIPGAEASVLGALKRRFGADRIIYLPPLEASIIKIDRGADVKRAAEACSVMSGVEYAEPNYIAEALAVFPDDAYFHLQWYLERIGMPEAWELYRGSPDVIVGVVDSGVESTHPDLAGKFTAGYNFVHDSGDTYDDNGHGTYIAGIIGAEANNGLGIAGINWHVRIMPIKSLDMFGAGAYSDVAAGIIFAADNGADVINLSLGGEQYSRLLEEAVNYARGKGCLLVAASGNTNSEKVFYPAAYKNVIAVAASNENDDRCGEEEWGPESGSNYGPEIEIAAPGNNILSTFIGGGFASGSGTSAAAAVVSGAAAVIIAADPALSPDEIRWIINSTADNHEDGWNSETGHGILYASRALDNLDLIPDLGLPRRWPFHKPPGEFFRWVNPPVD
jgi:thermitase